MINSIDLINSIFLYLETVKSTKKIVLKQNDGSSMFLRQEPEKVCGYVSKMKKDCIRGCRSERKELYVVGAGHRSEILNYVFELTDEGEPRNELEFRTKNLPHITHIIDEDDDGALLVCCRGMDLHVLTSEGEACKVKIEARHLDHLIKSAFFLDNYLYILSERFLIQYVSV